jgi:TonB family protein
MKKFNHSFAIAIAGTVLVVMTVAQSVFAQQVSVDSRSLEEHVISKAPLVYPAIAKAARIEGIVILQIEIDADGKVISTKTVSGPPMLVQAATDSVKQWKYRPFEGDGLKVPATGRVSLIFTLGGADQPAPPKGTRQGEETKSATVVVKSSFTDLPDGGISSKFFPLWNECTRGVIAHQRDKDTASACKQAAGIAETFPPDQRFIEKRSAFVYAATALANIGDLDNALIYAKKAVVEVKLGYDDDSGDDAAYSACGQIEGLLGNYAQADRDLTIAEDHERKAVAWAQKNASALVPGYEHVLQNDLRFHAQVLMRMDRSVDAQGKLDEASKL